MRIDKLSVINYKNIEQASLTFSPAINCLCGDNGMGKTNVLDAIFYLSRLKSSAQTLDEQNVHHGSDGFMLKGYYTDDAGNQKEVSCGYANGRKSVRVNDKAVRRFSDHLGQVPLVMIAPSDSQLVSGGSGERRRFMDATISQQDVAYLDSIIRYERSLHQRNVMLRNAAERNQPIDKSLLEVLETMMEQDAAVIFDRRRSFVDVFLSIFQEVYGNLCNVDSEDVSFTYVTQADRGSLHELFEAGRMKEQIVGYSLYGPHKDDLEFTISGYPLRREGSQGQTKTFFIAMKIAQYLYLKTRGRAVTPILLLDDIFDKLDEGRVQKIVAYTIGTALGQVFITDTAKERVKEVLKLTDRSSKLFVVKDGIVTEEPDK